MSSVRLHLQSRMLAGALELRRRPSPRLFSPTRQGCRSASFGWVFGAPSTEPPPRDERRWSLSADCPLRTVPHAALRSVRGRLRRSGPFFARPKHARMEFEVKDGPKAAACGGLRSLSSNSIRAEWSPSKEWLTERLRGPGRVHPRPASRASASPNPAACIARCTLFWNAASRPVASSPALSATASQSASTQGRSLFAKSDST